MDASGAEGEPVSSGTRSVASVYVIPGSHACRTGMLLLEHKGIDYRVIELPTGLHPQLVRLLGFPGRNRSRTVDGGTNPMLATLDRFGTVPAVRIDGERVQTNIALVRHLEERYPDPPLFPTDPAQRGEVEEALQWGDDVLQMTARRLVIAVGARGLDQMRGRGSHGRLGALLAHSELWRLVMGNVAGRLVFRASPSSEAALREEVPAQLDRIDAWIAAGVLDGAELNAADLMITPSLALLDYLPDQRAELGRRPAGALLDRVLPEQLGPGAPAAAAGAPHAGAAAAAR